MSQSDTPEEHSSQEPPKPRKLPQQSRSRILVQSIKEACEMILKREGPQGLTVTKIADLSGVAMGSIYQYFPNVDAIVATIYEDQIEADIEIARKKVATHYCDKTLENTIMSLIKGTLNFHQRMLDLDRDFHQRFYQTFDLQRWFNQRAGDEHAATRTFYNILIAHQDEYEMVDPKLEAFMLSAAFHNTILEAVKYHPEYISSEQFRHYLLRMGLGILKLTPSSDTGQVSGKGHETI